MGKARLERIVKLKNNFKLVVTDSRTGEIRQEAYAYNHILDQGFQYIFNWFAPNAARGFFMRGGFTAYDTSRFGGAISIGTGTGALNVTRTDLFTALGRKFADYYDRELNWEEQWASYTQYVTWHAGEHTGQIITEVGLGTRDIANRLTTHALIEDSEGNPISITKGEFDVLTVYAKVYIEVEHLHGDQVGLVTAESSHLPTSYIQHDDYGGFLLDMVYRNIGTQTATNAYYYLFAGNNGSLPWRHDKNAIGKDYFMKQESGNDVISKGILTTDLGAKTITFSDRVQANEANLRQGLWEIGMVIGLVSTFTEFGGTMLSSVFRASLWEPGASALWQGYDLENEEIGAGDGVETEFALDWGHIVEGSNEIKVNDVVVTNYTLYRGARAGDNILEGKMLSWDHSAFTGRTTTNNVNLWPLDGTSDLLQVRLASSQSIFDPQPWLEFDLGSPEYADNFKVRKTGANQIREMELQGSSDGTTWVTILDLNETDLPNSAATYEFPFTEVQYRYYKLLFKRGYQTATAHTVGQFELTHSRPQLVFDAAPADGHSITGSYKVVNVPKDVNHVFDIEAVLTFSDGNVV